VLKVGQVHQIVVVEIRVLPTRVAASGVRQPNSVVGKSNGAI
jgi:hypothetical protein